MTPGGPARRVLVVGAAGEIGTELARRLPSILGDPYELALVDLRAAVDADPPVQPLDITDLDAYARACEGIDTVVHLAGERDHSAPWERLLPANVIGAYHAFEAARRGGCRRVVFASSVHTCTGYPSEVQVRPEMPTHPGNLYGATKIWGESVASVYADHHGLSCLCLRIGWAGDRADARKLSVPQALAVYLTYDDAAQLVAACVTAPDELRFGIFNATSDNRYKLLDITDARAILGYEPQDDAFVLRERLGLG